MFVEGGKPENPEKKLNAQMALGWNQTQATLVEGECSHHCATLADLSIPSLSTDMLCVERD